MRGLHLIQLPGKNVQLWRCGHLQRKPVFAVKLPEDGVKQIMHFCSLVLRLNEQTLQAQKGSGIGLVDTPFHETGITQRTIENARLLEQLVVAQQVINLLEQFVVHDANGVGAAHGVFKIFLLLGNTQTLVTHNRIAFSLQSCKFGQLFGHFGRAQIQHALHLFTHMLRVNSHLCPHDLLTARNDAPGQHVLECIQMAAPEQLGVAIDLGHQSFLRRYRHDPVFSDAQNTGRFDTLAFNLPLYLFGCAQCIPKRVNLVKRHKTCCIIVGTGKKFAPDCQIRSRHAGVCRQKEYHCLGLWNQTHGQFGLGPDGIETRRVQNDKTLPEKRMVHIDARVTPTRHLDHSSRSRQGFIRHAVVPKSQGARFRNGDLYGFCHLAKCGGKLIGVSHIQSNRDPLIGHQPPFHQ